jgi:hypothetical protein
MTVPSIRFNVHKKKFGALLLLTVSLFFLYEQTSIDLPIVDDPEVHRMLALDPHMKKLYDTDHGCISRKNKLVYVHVPKTGGSTMENSGLFNDAKTAGNKLGGHHPVRVMLQDRKLRKMDGFLVAAHIRHPCERFISAFNYLQGGHGNIHDTKWAEEHISPHTSVDDFVHDVEVNNRWKELKTTAHFNTQASLMIHNKIFEVDEVLCQDQWNEGLNRLYGKLGLDVPDQLLVKEKKSNTLMKLKLEHQSCSDLKPETQRAIMKFHAMDYCLFNYPIEPMEQKCVGSYTRKGEFTARYYNCRTWLGE